jgi:hypothetical protein
LGTSGDLRYVLTQADQTTGDNTINFSVTGTITLNSALPELSNTTGLTDIEGPGRASLTVARSGAAGTPDFGILTVNSGADVKLVGLTITGGSARNSAGEGGGLYNSGTATVTNCTVSGNTSYVGGGIYNDTGGTATVIDSAVSGNTALRGGGIYGTVTVSDSTFSGNYAVIAGGGIDGTATVNDSTFSDNLARGDGGGIDGTATVTNCTFTDNTAFEGNGGGIDGTATVIDSTFSDNLATAGSANSGALEGNGGGIDGTATVIDSTFTDNTAFEGNGGGIDGTATVTNCTFTGNEAIAGNSGGYGGGICGGGTVNDSTFSGNWAGRDGGGIYVTSYGTATVSNSTFTGNSANGYYALGYGGGHCNTGAAIMTNCTVSGNTSYGAGGGIANEVGSANLTLTNTIVAGNTNTGTSDNDLFGQVQPTSAFNLVGDGSGIVNLTGLEEPALGNLIGTMARPLAPLLGPLANYGGPTRTMALLPGSPAIDAGTTGAGVPATDQRGFGRVGAVDIGAFESQGFTLTPVAGSTPQATVAGTAFAHPLAVTVTPNNPVEPVNGGVITFVANPAVNGASATLSASLAVIAGGQASVVATANGIGGSYTVTASSAGATPVKFLLATTYKITAVFDQNQPHQSGSTIPIKIEVADALGNNVGSSSLPVVAVSVVGPGGNPVPLTAPGNSQPGNLFTFDPTTGTYQFKLNTKGYKPGTYTLFFTVGDDPTLHSVSFVIR